MSRSDRFNSPAKKAVALSYGEFDEAPVIVASGMGYMAEKICETAAENGVPIYEDNSLATILTQMQLGQEIPENLYQAIVEIYAYFLNFDPNDPGKSAQFGENKKPAQAGEAANDEDQAQTQGSASPETAQA